jgi:hypothetical protein
MAVIAYVKLKKKSLWNCPSPLALYSSNSVNDIGGGGGAIFQRLQISRYFSSGLFVYFLMPYKVQHTEILWFQVFRATSMKMFWTIALCILAEFDQRFKGVYCLHHQSITMRCSKHLWNVGEVLNDYTVQYPGRLSSSGWTTVYPSGARHINPE